MPARLTVYVRENDRWHHRPLSTEIVHRAHAAGLAGASVFHGVEGYGVSQRIHTQRILSLGDDLPCCIVIVDRAERLRTFADDIAELVHGSLVTLEDVEVIDTGRPSPSLPAETERDA
jgi:PII-like signaling protein